MDLGVILFGLLIVLVTVFLDPASAIAGTAVGMLARQEVFGRSWAKFLAGIAGAVVLAQATSYFRFPGYEPSLGSVVAGSFICLACALVFGANVFKLTGNLARPHQGGSGR